MPVDVVPRLEPESDGRPRRSSRRVWTFRIAAVLLGIAPFLLFEGVCALCGWGRPDVHDDPFVGFSAVRPLFVLNDNQSRYEIPKARQTHFRPASFAAEKPGNGFRIFCLGGSTVQGRPFAVETSFTTWLEIALRSADPSRQWEVVNCGGVSYASYRLVPILEEVLRHDPDLIIIYTGHNEFLEARNFEHIEQRGPVVNEALRALSHVRTFTLLREGYLQLRGRSSSDPPESRPILPTEVEALLDYRGGLRDYHHDEAWRSGVVAQFRFNLRRMIDLAQDAGVDVVLVNPVSNFADSPPFKSEHDPTLSQQQQERWAACTVDARRYLRGKDRDLRKAIKLFDQACQIDPMHATGFYNLAKCYEAAGQFDQAREAYLQAKEVDVCPLRILQPMNDIVLEIAEDTGTPLVDAQRLFEGLSEGGIVGRRWLVDHVHPSIEGHQRLADALAENLIALEIAEPAPDWQEIKQRQYRAHFEALDDHYFAKGVERRRAVAGWAAGRARRLRSGESGRSRTPESESTNSSPASTKGP